MTFRYLIWDFDGTLFDTYPPLNHAIRQAAADFGQDVSEARVAALLSETMNDTINTLADEFGLAVDTFKEHVYVYWDRVTIDDCPPIPGAIRVCEQFRAAGGLNFIYTHRGLESLVEFLDHYDVSGLFTDTFTRDDGFPRKPDPTGFLALIGKHNLPKAEVLAVGDRDLDILAAHGAEVAGCLFDAQPGDGVQPEYVIADFGELARVLDL